MEALSALVGRRSAEFLLRNSGFTHAVKVVVRDEDGRVLREIDEIEPDAAVPVLELHEDEEDDVKIEFNDVWGRTYTSTWLVAGPEFEELEYEGEPFIFFEPFSIERLN